MAQSKVKEDAGMTPGEMWPGETFEATLRAARLADPVIDMRNGRTLTFAPPGFQLLEHHDPYAVPPYIWGEIELDEREALVRYVNRFSDARSVVIADYDAGAVRAVLDYHADSGAGLTAGPCRHGATLKLRASEEFARWSAAQGKLVEQSEFAAFLEENSEDIVDPDPAVMIEISRDLEATQGVTFKSSNRLESGDRAFVYETETRTRGEVKVPREFKLEIPLYQGEAPVVLRCAFRFRVGGGGLMLGFEWRRVEYARQAYFAQIAHQVSEETGRPLFIGRVR